MWWQGKNQGNQRHHGYAEFNFESSSDSGISLFKGKFYDAATTYTLEKGEIKGDQFTFRTTTLDRQENTDRTSQIVGQGICGRYGSFGSFAYIEAGNLYEFDFFIESQQETKQQ